MEALTPAHKEISGLFKSSRVKLAYAFGSSVHGKTDIFSDVDIGVVFGKVFSFNRKLKLYSHLTDTLEQHLQCKPVDVIFMDEVPMELQFEIITTGRLLFSEKESFRVSYETAIQRQFMDFKGFLDKTYKDIIYSVKENPLFAK